jgi:ferredoxin-NADP reductase
VHPDGEYHSLTIDTVVEETDDTRSFVLAVPDSLAATFEYSAGQFCTFRAEIAGHQVVRCYSMSSAPDLGEPLTVTVKRVPEGLMSNWMIDTLRPGSSIDVMRPTGLFVLHERDTPIVAFAGGSGITPIISIIKRALATTARPIRLIYANRDAPHVIFAAALGRLEHDSNGQLQVHHHLDCERGLLDVAACADLIGGPRDTAGPGAAERLDCYVCGPGPFMGAVEAAAAERGVNPEHLFIERFFLPDPAAAGDPSPAAAAATRRTESLIVDLGGRRHTLVYQGGDTILEATRRGGLRAPFSCESGNCATCMARLDEGSARMRVNNALTPAEVDAGWVLTCQALPQSPTLVVNYDA